MGRGEKDGRWGGARGAAPKQEQLPMGRGERGIAPQQEQESKKLRLPPPAAESRLLKSMF